MITRRQQQEARRRAAAMIRQAGLVITEAEAGGIEVVDFGLGRLEAEGVQVLTLVQTERIGAKVLVLFPHQTEPEHWHPPVGADPGKEETVRVVAGTVYFYVDGPDTLERGFLVPGEGDHYTVRHEVVLTPGSQITLAPGARHWFQARDDGAVMFSFSTIARDALDGFTNPSIERITRVSDA